MLARSSSTPRRLIVMYFSPVSPPTASSLEGLADHRGGCSDRRCPGSPGDGRRAGRAPRIYRASSLARGSRRHESVGEGGAGRDRPLRPTQGVPHPTQGVRTFDNHCTGILVFGSTACGGSREVGILLAQAASSSAQRQWRSLGARSMLDARSFMISTLRSQVGFAAAVAHARLRLSRLELIGGSGRTAGRYASAARAFISPTAFEQARGGALGAGGGRVGFAGGGLF